MRNFMNIVKSTLTFSAITLIVIAMSGSSCHFKPAPCNTFTDQDTCNALTFCAWTQEGTCIDSINGTCIATDLTATASTDCATAATDEDSCLAVSIVDPPSGATTSACVFTAAVPSCLVDIAGEAEACAALANACTVVVANEATGCASLTTVEDCTSTANAAFCAWDADAETCGPLFTTSCTVDVDAEATACATLLTSTDCTTPPNDSFCIWDTRTTPALCAPISTTQPEAGNDFDACAAQDASSGGCAAITVGGTAVCAFTAGPSEGTDFDACAAANADSTTCTGVVVGATVVCAFTASTCSGSPDFCIDESPTECLPVSESQPTSGTDFDACAAAVGAGCDSVSVGATTVCTAFDNTCAVAANDVIEAACGGLAIRNCKGTAINADFCAITGP